jgi:hypothetical protein
MNWFNVSPPSFARKLLDRCVTFQTVENRNPQFPLFFEPFVRRFPLFVCLFVCLLVTLVTGPTAAPLSVVRCRVEGDICKADEKACFRVLPVSSSCVRQWKV